MTSRPRDDVDDEMRDVLTQLALTSNGSTASIGRSSGTGQSDGIPRLSAGDAPHLKWASIYQHSASRADREWCVTRASDELRSIRHGSSDRDAGETLPELEARIVERGEGMTIDEASVHFRCLQSRVRAARRNVGRDEDLGRKPRNGRALPVEQRQALVRAEVAAGRSARQVAVSLGLSYSTVRRDLGVKA